MTDNERTELARLINELDLSHGKVYKSGGVWFIDGEKLNRTQPRLGNKTTLQMTIDNAVIIEGQNRR